MGRTSGSKFIRGTKTLERGGAPGPPPDLIAGVTLRQQRAPVGYREQERPRHPSRLQSLDIKAARWNTGSGNWHLTTGKRLEAPPFLLTQA